MLDPAVSVCCPSAVPQCPHTVQCVLDWLTYALPESLRCRQVRAGLAAYAKKGPSKQLAIVALNAPLEAFACIVSQSRPASARPPQVNLAGRTKTAFQATWSDASELEGCFGKGWEHISLAGRNSERVALNHTIVADGPYTLKYELGNAGEGKCPSFVLECRRIRLHGNVGGVPSAQVQDQVHSDSHGLPQSRPTQVWGEAWPAGITADVLENEMIVAFSRAEEEQPECRGGSRTGNGAQVVRDPAAVRGCNVPNGGGQIPHSPPPCTAALATGTGVGGDAGGAEVIQERRSAQDTDSTPTAKKSTLADTGATGATTAADDVPPPRDGEAPLVDDEDRRDMRLSPVPLSTEEAQLPASSPSPTGVGSYAAPIPAADQGLCDVRLSPVSLSTEEASPPSPRTGDGLYAQEFMAQVNAASAQAGKGRGAVRGRPRTAVKGQSGQAVGRGVTKNASRTPTASRTPATMPRAQQGSSSAALAGIPPCALWGPVPTSLSLPHALHASAAADRPAGMMGYSAPPTFWEMSLNQDFI